MRHHNSVFHQLLKHLPWDDFDRLARAHRADARARRLTSKSQFLAMLYGPLAGAASLREIVSGIESHAARLYHLGAQLPRRSTLADANHDRPSALFTELLALLMARAHRGLRRRLAETTYLIDATGLRLDARSLHWARFSEGVCGAKLHVIYDPAADRPIYAAITAARVNDITAAQAMPIEPGATYVFDLGYYDYAWWAKLDAAQCRIVTRLKSNTPLTTIEELPVPSDGPILSDRIGHLPARLSKSRNNPFEDPVREVRVGREDGPAVGDRVPRVVDPGQRVDRGRSRVPEPVRIEVAGGRHVDRRFDEHRLVHARVGQVVGHRPALEPERHHHDAEDGPPDRSESPTRARWGGHLAARRSRRDTCIRARRHQDTLARRS